MSHESGYRNPTDVSPLATRATHAFLCITGVKLHSYSTILSSSACSSHGKPLIDVLESPKTIPISLTRKLRRMN